MWTKSSLEHCRQAKGYAGGADGPWDRIPKDPNVGRWLYVSMAARHVIELREAREALGLALHGLLADMEDSEYAGKQPTREMWAYLADMCEDGRFVSFCMFEAEYAKEIYDKRMALIRSPTQQGFKGVFGIMDYAEHYHYVDMEMRRKLQANYGAVLPKTFAQVEKVRLSDLHRGLEATDDERKEAACALADDLHERIQEGAQLFAQEQTKNYRYLGEMPFIFLYMFCRGRAGACVRAMLSVLCDTFSKFDDVDFMRANDFFLTTAGFSCACAPAPRSSTSSSSC